MKEVRITPEQAREYISIQHGDGLEVPRHYRFDRISNHLEACVVWVAMTEQVADLRFLYSAFYRLSPGTLGLRHGYTHAQNREYGYKYFDSTVAEAEEFKSEQFAEDPIETLQYLMANKWRLDDTVVNIYAVDSEGTACNVGHMGGYVNPNERAWQYIEEGIQGGIQREFPE